MGPLRARQRTLHGAEVKIHDFSGVGRICLSAIVLHEHVLLTKIFLDELDVALITASESKIVHGVRIDGEVAHGSTVLRCHVRDSGSVSEAEILDTRSKELNKLADDTTLTEHLDTSEDQVSRGGSLGKLSVQVETDDLRKHHGDGLSEHDSLSLDTTDTPTSDAQTVDHGRVRVSADDRVRVEHVVAVKHHACKVLKVDLVDNTRAWRHDLKVVKSFGAPFEELESLAVT